MSCKQFDDYVSTPASKYNRKPLDFHYWQEVFALARELGGPELQRRIAYQMELQAKIEAAYRSMIAYGSSLKSTAIPATDEAAVIESQ